MSMKSLMNYIYEANLSKNDFYKHNMLYVKSAIKMLLDNKIIHLGVSGQNGECSLANFDKDKLLNLQNNLDDNKQISVNDFNDCILDEFKNKVSWTKLCKFDIRGVAIGQGNKGEEFEKLFVKDICSPESKYAENLIEVIRHDEKYKDMPIPLNIETVHHVGINNTKRPLKVVSKTNKLVVANTISKTNDIGEIIADVSITPTKNKSDNIYLSLKEGAKVTFCNCGVNNDDFFKKSCFENNEEFGNAGKQLLKLLSIDEQMFREIFNTFNKNTEKHQRTEIDVTDKISKEDFFYFCKSVIGYGYILVHLDKGNVHYYDLRNAEQLNEFLGDNIVKATLMYNIGYTKRIDINIILDKIEILFNIRNKQSGIYPTHLMSDYKIKDNIN